MDITQSVFVKVYENLHLYNPKHKLFSWIYKIAVNESLNLTKRIQRFTDLQNGLESSIPNPEQSLIRNEVHDHLVEALGALTFEYRAVLVLKHFMDLSYREIGQILEIPEKTVKSRLYTGRQQLKDLMIQRGYAS